MSERGEFHGEVNAEGSLRFDNAIAWKARMAQLRSRRVIVTVEREQPTRSLAANRRYWGLLVPLAGHLLSRTRDVPLSKEQVHYVLASAFAGTEETELGVPVPVKTSRFTVEQFHTYCTRIEVWLGENGYPVPELGEVMEASL